MFLQLKTEEALTQNLFPPVCMRLVRVNPLVIIPSNTVSHLNPSPNGYIFKIYDQFERDLVQRTCPQGFLPGRGAVD